MKELLKRMLEAHRFWITMKGDRVVPIQHQFPCCEKYDKCCDETWSKKLERIFKMPIATIYTIHTEKDRIEAPEDFEHDRD